jgi:hypothetical protein
VVVRELAQLRIESVIPSTQGVLAQFGVNELLVKVVPYLHV